jgi:hypothetical protein
MPRELSSRFAGRIRWIGFQNQSGQSIPPYSIIEASGWQMPDPSGSDVSVTSPVVLAGQPSDPINPYACYITGAATVPAGANGVCAQPTLDLPLLVSLSGSQQDGNDAPFRMCGPSNGTWTATRDIPGLAMVDRPKQGYALVVPTRGPYAGNLPQNQSMTGGSIQITTFVAPTGNASSKRLTVYNPYGNIDTTRQGAILRCTYDWVNDTGQWELIAADPCPPDGDDGDDGGDDGDGGGGQ